MRKKRLQVLFVLLLIFVLIATLTVPIFASASSKQSAWIPLSKPISVEGKGTIELKTIYAVPSKDGQVVSFTFELTNQSDQIIDFFDYWIRLSTKGGTKYPLKLIEQGSDRIYPKQKKTYIFYSVLPLNEKIADLRLRFIKWDFSAPGFERDLGQFTIHVPTISQLGKSAVKFLGLTDNRIEAKMVQGTVETKDNKKTIFYTLKLVNKGYQAFTLPKYEYVLITDQGFAYPLKVTQNAGESETTQLLPLMEKEIQLTGEVPSSVDLSKASVYILYPHSNDKGETLVPITLFRTFETVVKEPEKPKETLQFGEGAELITAKQEKLKLTFSKVQRLPWDSRDLLSAQFILSNLSDASVEIPSFEGKIKLGKNYEVNAEVILDSNKKHLNPGESATYLVTSYFPYTTVFHEGEVELSEKSAEGKTKLIVSTVPKFHFVEGSLSLDEVAGNATHEMGAEGERSTLKMLQTRSYRTSNGYILAALLEVKNLERRGVNVPKLIGVYKSPDGSIYPTKIGEYAPTNFPNGSSVITLWAEIPKEIQQESLQLLVGEAVGETGMRNAVKFSIAKDDLSSKDSVHSIELYPYTIYLKRYNEYELAYDYKKVPGVIANLGDRKLVLEFTNFFGEVLKRETVVVEGSGAWEIGHTIPISGYSYVFVYEEFQGGRKLIASEWLGQ